MNRRRLPPHNLAAEESTLGACLLFPAALDAVIATGLAVPDFYRLGHQLIFDCIRAVHDRDGWVDVVTVGEELRKAGTLEEAGGIERLQELITVLPAASNAKRYAQIVRDTSLLRKMLQFSAEVSERAYDEPDDIHSVLEELRWKLDNLDDWSETVGQPDQDVDEFIASVPSAHDWMVPGFMEYMDRMIVTAIEGGGKSVLLTQIAVCVASGLHPWTLNAVEPRRVLLIDCENNERLLNRRLTGLRAKVRYALDPAFLRVISKPDGLNLSERPDRRWLLDRVLANQADLLVIGPLYRLERGVAQHGDIGGQDAARVVSETLNTVRNQGHCSVIVEAHAAKGNATGRDLAPFGSTVWMRWPDFGVGLRQDTEIDDDYRVQHWRPPRDERIWPKILRRGGEWPWTPLWPDGRPAHPE